MKASEIFQRNLAILSNVSAKSIRNNSLSDVEIDRVAKIRSSMFLEGIKEYEEFLNHKNRFKFESNLINNYTLDPNKQLIIVHDASLSIATIDIHLQKLKSKYGDKLKVAVIDYINQVSLDGHRDDRYDWKVQIEIAAKLKEFASKYDILIASAYQIDSTNEARFSKGILDSPDISYILDTANKSDGVIAFQNTKTRSSEPLDFKCPIDWDTLRIHPTEISVTSIAKPVTVRLSRDKDDIPF
jgi:replicative DNA helicase